MLTPLVKHIASGQAFFSGVGLLILAAVLVRRRRQRSANVAWAVGLLLTIVSATPLALAFYVVAGALSVAWIVSAQRPAGSPDLQRTPTQDGTRPEVASRQGKLLTRMFLIVWGVGAAVEIPYHVMPAVPHSTAPRLTIFADSVTAGMGEREAITWPQLLADAHPVEVVDHSRMGATAASATTLAHQHPPEPGVVLLEIGGNDILGSTTAPEFERTLEELLQAATGPDRQVVMLELPLPPLFNRYGRIQRELARRYHVALIPKSFLLDVLLSSSTTLDSIHLSQEGHQRMADRMWTLLSPSFDRDD